MCGSMGSCGSTSRQAKVEDSSSEAHRLTANWELNLKQLPPATRGFFAGNLWNPSRSTFEAEAESSGFQRRPRHRPPPPFPQQVPLPHWTAAGGPTGRTTCADAESDSSQLPDDAGRGSEGRPRDRAGSHQGTEAFEKNQQHQRLPPRSRTDRVDPALPFPCFRNVGLRTLLGRAVCEFAVSAVRHLSGHSAGCVVRNAV